VSGSEEARRAAGAAAAELLSPGMTVGFGSGRTLWHVIEQADSSGIRAAAASSRTEELAREAGFELVELDEALDVAIDGADEVDPQLGLIKGGGGALLREKIVVQAAARFVVVAEESKLVQRLGETFRLPVEVVRFGWRRTHAALRELGLDGELRGEGEPYVTDEGHYILDCPLPGDREVEELAAEIKAVTGVVEHGLFLGVADEALIGRADGSVERLQAR
jgi:ribose 5-phosphate isomerase A